MKEENECKRMSKTMEVEMEMEGEIEMEVEMEMAMEMDPPKPDQESTKRLPKKLQEAQTRLLGDALGALGGP